jgi:hypothetical protein
VGKTNGYKIMLGKFHREHHFEGDGRIILNCCYGPYKCENRSGFGLYYIMTGLGISYDEFSLPHCRECLNNMYFVKSLFGY